MDKAKLEQMNKWMGFVGIMTIIGGAISAIMGAIPFVLPAIPGIIMIILGVKLLNAKQNAALMLKEDPDGGYTSSFNQLVGNLSTYFTIQGILIIIALVFAVIGIIAALIFGFTFLNLLGGSMYY